MVVKVTGWSHKGGLVEEENDSLTFVLASKKVVIFRSSYDGVSVYYTCRRSDEVKFLLFLHFCMAFSFTSGTFCTVGEPQ